MQESARGPSVGAIKSVRQPWSLRLYVAQCLVDKSGHFGVEVRCLECRCTYSDDGYLAGEFVALTLSLPSVSVLCVLIKSAPQTYQPRISRRHAPTTERVCVCVILLIASKVTTRLIVISSPRRSVGSVERSGGHNGIFSAVDISR